MNDVSFLSAMCHRGRSLLLVSAAMLLTQQGTSAQLTYRSGQPVSAAYEGWEEDPDGSRYFLFRYMNANWEEELDVPVGLDNYVVFGEPGTGGADAEAFDPKVADRIHRRRLRTASSRLG